MKYMVLREVEASNPKEAESKMDGLIFVREKQFSNVSVHTAIFAEKWPIWAKSLKHFAKPEDSGIGDVVARMIGDEKSAAFKAWHYATFGKPCNCSGRQARWNRLYPLP